MQRPRNIALLVESSRAYGRGLLRGIARFARQRSDWALSHQEWDLDDELPPWLVPGSCDGVIARIDRSDLVRSLRRLKVPIVDLRALKHYADIPTISTDEMGVARLAADHLLERGFRRFGFCGLRGVDYSTNRRKQFVDYLESMQHTVEVYEGNAGRPANSTRQKESQAMCHEGELGDWIRSLPKPIAVMACNDIRGRRLLSACRDHNIAAPDEIAVIGVDDDEVLCELSAPPLSSVVPATERIGYEAAAILQGLMDGHVPAQQHVLVEPVGVASRASTDFLAVDDVVVATAVRFIRARACEPISVEDVVAHIAEMLPAAAGSRSTLSRRFAEALGRSPKDEIVRVKVARIKQLLLDTDETIAQVAARVGIEHPEHLATLFKRETSETPGTFRRRRGS